MQQWHGLEWTFETPDTTVNFMDLTITIAGGRLKTTLYEKPQNLYLFLPPHSSHPQGVLSGLVFGQILGTRRLCSRQEDADKKIMEFFQRLLNRGHRKASLTPLFTRAEENARRYTVQTQQEHSQRKNKKPLTLGPQSSFTFSFTLRSHLQRLFKDSGVTL